MSTILHNKIVHILEKESNNLILTDYELASNPDADKLYTKLYKSVATNEFTRRATFNNYNESLVRRLSEEIIYDTSKFVENSKEIAKLLFDETLLSPDMESCSLAIALFSVKDEKKVGIFKIDFKKNLSSKINDSDDGRVAIDIVESNNSFSSSLKSNQAFIIGSTGINDEFHILVLDKDAEKNGSDSSFIDKFLDATKLEDDIYKTKVFKQTAENFITNYFYEDAKEAEDARNYLHYNLSNKESINPEQFIKDIVKDEDKREIAEELFQEKNLTAPIEIDKKWIEKKLKKRRFKTDNGFKLEGNSEDFDDPMKYSVTKNKDGSINITLKNIKLIEY